MKGSIQAQPDGGYRGYVTVDGKRLYRRGRTKKELAGRLKKATENIKGPAKAGLTVECWMREFLSGQQARLGLSLKHRTFEAYEGNVRRYIVPELGKVELAELDATRIEKWHGRLLKRGLSPWTVNQAHRTLSTALQVAYTRRLVDRNEARLVHPPTTQQDEAPPRIDPRTGRQAPGRSRS